MQATSRAFSIARATASDLARRPGALLSLGCAALLLVLLPRLAARALDDGAALATELTITTVWLYASLVAALAGVRAAQQDAPFGPTPEILVTPLRSVEYLIGRAAGVAAAALAYAGILCVVAGLAMSLGGAPPMLGGLLVVALLAGSLQVLVHVTAGLAAGALLGGGLGTVVVLAWFVAARLWLPGIADAAAMGWIVPDVSRLDLSRPAAFARPVGAAALAVIALSALLQAAGLLALAHAALFRHRPSAEPHHGP